MIKERINPLGNVATTLYDHANRPIAQVDAENQVTSSDYFANGWRRRVTNPRGYATSYSYDGDNRSTLIKNSLGNDTLLSYEAAFQLAFRLIISLK